MRNDIFYIVPGEVVAFQNPGHAAAHILNGEFEGFLSVHIYVRGFFLHSIKRRISRMRRNFYNIVAANRFNNRIYIIIALTENSRPCAVAEYNTGVSVGIVNKL